MGFWDVFSGSASTQTTNTNQNTTNYGTTTPNLSSQWTDAYNAYLNSLGFPSNNTTPTAANPTGVATPTTTATGATTTPGVPAATPNVAATTVPAGGSQVGANATQQSGINTLNGITSPSSLLNTTVPSTTNDLQNQSNDYTYLNEDFTGNIAKQAAPQIAAAAQAGPTSTVTAPTVASLMGAYAPLYSQALIQPSLNAFDYGSQLNNNNLNAQIAGAGAFANSRSGVAQGTLGAQEALGRGQLAQSLLTSGLTSAGQLASTDAGNLLSASGQNAALTQQQNLTNAGLLQQTNQANLGAQQTNTSQQLAAQQQMAANVAAQTGISQDIINNIVTASGINLQAAQALVASGAITQSQLQTLIAAAQASNGSSLTQNGTTTGTSTTDKLSASLNA